MLFTQPPRIVSLLPSATEILACLDLTSFIVGRSHECDYPAEIGDRPICTSARLDSNRSSVEIDQDVLELLQAALSIYEVKIDVLRDLKPTHIVTQDQCDVCAVSFGDVEKAVATLAEPQPQIISLQPDTLTDVWSDIARVAAQFELDAKPILEQLQQRVAVCHQRTQALAATQRPKVAAIEWIEPLMSGGNWLPELIEIAGGQNILGKHGEHSPYIDWDSLIEQDPDIIVVMPCGFDLKRTRQEMLDNIASQPKWHKLRAVQENQLYICDGNAYFNRPGPRLVDSIAILTEIIHPQSFKRTYTHSDWSKLTVV